MLSLELLLNKALLTYWVSERPCPETWMAGVEMAGMGGPKLTSTEQAYADPSEQLCVLPVEALHSQGSLQGPPREKTRGSTSGPQTPVPMGILSTSR